MQVYSNSVTHESHGTGKDSYLCASNEKEKKNLMLSTDFNQIKFCLVISSVLIVSMSSSPAPQLALAAVGEDWV